MIYWQGSTQMPRKSAPNLRSKLIPVIVALGSGMIGFCVGALSTANDTPQDTSSASDVAPSEAPPAIQRMNRRLVCTSLGRRAGTEDEDCESLGLEFRWCEMELNQCLNQKDVVRQEWPESESSIEAPGQWSDAVEEALDICGVTAELELIDCSEYPCAAGLRSSTTSGDEKVQEQEMERLTKAIRSCEVLRSSFGIVGSDNEDALDIFRLDAKCGNNRENFFALVALDPGGPAYALYTNQDRSATEERDLFRWIYRRADDLSSLWPCEK